MIEITNLSLILNNKTILKNINASFDYGHIYGLTGNNGSGKTMLMRVICGLIPPTEGSVCCDGKIIGKDCDFLRDAGTIIETPGFIPYYSGIKNLRLLAGINRKAGKEKIKETMQRCGLDPELKLSVGKYSLGMRQRLGLAQAVMEDQKILILDEPMNGLDKSGVEEMRKMLLEFKSDGRLIILASHNKDDIRILCDEVYEMEMGEMRQIVD